LSRPNPKTRKNKFNLFGIQIEYNKIDSNNIIYRINNYNTIESKPLNDFAFGMLSFEIASRDSWLGQERDRLSYL